MVDVILDEATEGSVFLSPTMLMTDSSSADLPMETQDEPSIDEEQNITSAYPLLETSPVLNICGEPVTEQSELELTSNDTSEFNQANQLTELVEQLNILKDKLSVAEVQVLHANNTISELNSKLSFANARIVFLENSSEQRKTVEETIKNEPNAV